VVVVLLLLGVRMQWSTGLTNDVMLVIIVSAALRITARRASAAVMASVCASVFYYLTVAA